MPCDFDEIGVAMSGLSDLRERLRGTVRISAGGHPAQIFNNVTMVGGRGFGVAFLPDDQVVSLFA